MKSLLLDTHALLWFYGGSDELPVTVQQFIRNPVHQCYVSVASLWEITIKYSIGKLELGSSLDELFSFLVRNRFELLGIDLIHLTQLNQLPMHHKDPFDRLILAQALAEKLPIATRDTLFKPYGATIVW